MRGERESQRDASVIVMKLGFDLLTCIDDAMENALGWSMGMRSNKYGNGMLVLDEGKSLKTSRIVRLGLLQ